MQVKLEVDILLVHGNVKIHNPIERFMGIFENQGMSIHYGMGAISAYVKARGFSCKVIDANFDGLSIVETVDLISRYRPKLLGLSLNLYNLVGTLEIIKILKQKNIYHGHITAGGQFATSFAEELLQEFEQFDSVVMGEGEGATTDLLQTITDSTDWRKVAGIKYRDQDNKIVTTPSRRGESDLDRLPLIERYDVESGKMLPFQQIELGRGCYGSCTFCVLDTYHKISNAPKTRRRSLTSIFNEVESLYAKGCRIFLFRCDNFFQSTNSDEEDQYLRQFCHEITRRKLKIDFSISCRPDDLNKSRIELLESVGLCHLFIGIESINNDEIKLFGKGTSPSGVHEVIALLEKTNIYFECGYIFFNPWSTLENLKKSAEFLLEIGVEHFPYGTYQMKIHRDTAIEKLLQREGLALKGPIIQEDEIERAYLNYEFKYPDAGFIRDSSYQLWKKLCSYVLDNYLKSRKDSPSLVMQVNSTISKSVLSYIRDSINAWVKGKFSHEEDFLLEINKYYKRCVRELNKLR
ncbi:MAG: B12-binding domain-containing radical SAM protein [Bdellovibrio sp.]|nr:B12-binding domain-containing radical SAM protein [Bdellovibrio sp.]